jgi:hypothetical protein
MVDPKTHAKWGFLKIVSSYCILKILFLLNVKKDKIFIIFKIIIFSKYYIFETQHDQMMLHFTSTGLSIRFNCIVLID